MTNPPTDDPLTTLERLLKERDEAKAEYHLAIKKPFQSGVLWWTSKQRYEKADAVLTKHLRNLAPALVEVADDAGLVDRIATALRQAREEGRKEQQITAETVRRVRVATTAVLQSNQGLGGEMGAEQMQALDEAIAHRANIEVKHEG